MEEKNHQTIKFLNYTTNTGTDYTSVEFVWKVFEDPNKPDSIIQELVKESLVKFKWKCFFEQKLFSWDKVKTKIEEFRDKIINDAAITFPFNFNDYLTSLQKEEFEIKFI